MRMCKAEASIKAETVIFDGGSASSPYERWLVLEGVPLFVDGVRQEDVDTLRVCLDQPATRRLLETLTELLKRLVDEARAREDPPIPEWQKDKPKSRRKRKG